MKNIKNSQFLVIGPTFIDIAIQLKDFFNSKNNPINISIGGKGYNISHTLSLFNCSTILSTMYGKDKIGNYLHKQINNQGIQTLKTNFILKQSGVFIALNDNKGDTVIDRVDTSIFDFQNLPKIDWKKISVIIVVSSSNNKIFEYLKKMRKKYPHIKFCLEIAGRKTAENVMPYLAIFDMYISNLREAEFFGNKLKSRKNIKDILRKIHYSGPSLVMVTAGSNGIYLSVNEKDKFRMRHFLAKKYKKVVSTIGAGDSVTASFCAAYYGYKKSLEKSIDISLHTASVTVSSYRPFPEKIPSFILKKINSK